MKPSKMSGFGRTSLPILLMTLFLGLGCDGQILDTVTCIASRELFIRNGCLQDHTSPICALLGLELTFSIAGVPLCNQFPCEGYNQPANYRCRPFIFGGCLPSRMNFNGICGAFGVCCRR